MSFSVILAAAFGVSAAFSGDHCITYIFGYFMLLMFLFFGCIGASMVILSGRLTDDFDKECVAKTGIAYSIDQIYYEGQNTMCTKTCPCKITDKAKFPDIAKWKNHVINKSGYVRYLDCPTETMSDNHEMKYVPLLRTLEKQFNCAGMCDKPRFFLFSDINKGEPQQLCKDYAITHIKAHVGKFSGFCFLAAIIGFLGVVFSFSICYHKRNKL